MKNLLGEKNDQRPSLLDLILVNDDEMISNINHHSPLGRSDHEVLLFELYLPKEQKISTNNMSYEFKKGNYNKMRENCSEINWEILNDLKVNEAWEIIKNNVIKLMTEHIPQKKVNSGSKSKSAWMSNKVLKRIRKKYHA